MGMLTNITQRQSSHWTSIPPDTSSREKPPSETAVNSPSARTVGRLWEPGHQQRESGRRGDRGADALYRPGGQ